MRDWAFAKGHGTENDFVLLLDRDGSLDLSAADVVWICDRRAGIGADGVLRVVPGRFVSEWHGDPDVWFMDYRNADGSIAEMCGNGVRVFARFVVTQGLATGPRLPIGTRAGLREAELLPDGRVRVAMGPVRIGDATVSITTADGLTYAATPVDVGNPHAVGFTHDLARTPMQLPPTVAPAGVFPDGVNVELVQRISPGHIAMRVHERGSGETRSCGTGTVAAAAATHAADGAAGEGDLRYRVDVPGGTVEVELGDQAYLSGPAVLVAYGTMQLPDRGVADGTGPMTGPTSGED